VKRSENGLTSEERREIGVLMSHWHSSQGDPIYAVGSFFVDGKRYPDREQVSSALYWIEKDLGQARERKHGWGRKEVGELLKISKALKRELWTYPKPKEEDEL